MPEQARGGSSSAASGSPRAPQRPRGQSLRTPGSSQIRPSLSAQTGSYFDGAHGSSGHSDGVRSPTLSSAATTTFASERIFPIASVVSSSSNHPIDRRQTSSPSGSSHAAPPSAANSSSASGSGRDQRHANFDPTVSYFSHRPGPIDAGDDSGSPDGSTSATVSSATPRSGQHQQQQPAAIARRNSQASSAYGEDPVYAVPNEDEIIDRAVAAREAADRLGYGTPKSEILMTVRFEHAETDDGHMVVTGREGEVTRCEEEPIHMPGAIQAWGVLLALELDAQGRFKVVQVSENAGHILGLPPSFLFGLACFTDCLDPDEAETFHEAIQMLPSSDADLVEAGPHHFELAGAGVPGTGLDGPDSAAEWVCWCTMHVPARVDRPNLYVVEFELQDDPLNPAVTRQTDPIPEDERTALSAEPYEPTDEDLHESTVNAARPLRKRQLNKRRTANLTGADVFQTLNQVQDQLARAADLQTFLKIVVGVIQDLTGYHRVMIYQFDEEWNGQVVAEMVDWTKTRDLFRGLHFPATDIPAQARELYKLNKFRQLYDRDQPTARIVCRDRAELEWPIDMTHVALRAMSPIHIKYLANMGVRASGSISIVAFGTLWGLISCHSYGRYGMRMTSPQRQLCRVFGGDISRNIERLSYASRLQSRKLINTVSTKTNPSGYIVAKAEDLLSLFDAEFGCLSIGDEAKLLGPMENSQEVLAVLEYLRNKHFATIQSTQDVTADFPDLHCPGGFRIVAGFLLVPLSQAGRDFIVLFRQGQIKHIHWAGNPYDKVLKETADTRVQLEPRKSFKLWSETVMGKCRAWTDDQLETASVLCLVYGKFINVWRQKEVAMRSNQLTNLLLSNASHEVRTPLNAIVNYLEMALDGPLDGDTRDALSKSYSASKALVHVINDLLDLTRTEAGKDLYLQDPFDLPAIIQEAVAMHSDEARRRGLHFDVRCLTPNGPTTVLGDRARFKQVLANIVANAVKHTEEGGVTLEWGEVPHSEEQPLVESGAPGGYLFRATVTDTGTGMSTSKLDALFRQFEEVDSYDHISEAEKASQPSLGLGLAVVARIVKTLGGQLRVDSKEGAGSTFSVILPFQLPAEVNAGSPSLRRKSSLESVNSRLSRNGSFRSGTSSGGQSEIDSLVEDLSSNHMDPSVSRGDSTPSAPAPSRGLRISKDSLPARASPPLSGGAFSPPLVGRPSMPSPGNGAAPIEGSKIPVRPIRLPEESVDTTYLDRQAHSGRRQSAASEVGMAALPTPPDSPAQTPHEGPALASGDSKAQVAWSPVSQGSTVSGRRRSSAQSVDQSPLRVLVVEDDPINRAILQKKLTKEGHKVSLSVHGEEAVREIEKDPDFDIILMDIQMPICDGMTATKRIREVESTLAPNRSKPVSQRLVGRIPIVAVSASLLEKQRTELTDVGMDGYMLKPINFERMRLILSGVRSNSDRKAELYRPGHWEAGGWFV